MKKIITTIIIITMLTNLVTGCAGTADAETVPAISHVKEAVIGTKNVKLKIKSEKPVVQLGVSQVDQEDEKGQINIWMYEFYGESAGAEDLYSQAMETYSYDFSCKGNHAGPVEVNGIVYDTYTIDMEDKKEGEKESVILAEASIGETVLRYESRKQSEGTITAGDIEKAFSYISIAGDEPLTVTEMAARPEGVILSHESCYVKVTGLGTDGDVTISDSHISVDDSSGIQSGISVINAPVEDYLWQYEEDTDIVKILKKWETTYKGHKVILIKTVSDMEQVKIYDINGFVELEGGGFILLDKWKQTEMDETVSFDEDDIVSLLEKTEF